MDKEIIYDFYNKKRGRPSKKELEERKKWWGLKVKYGKFIVQFH